MAEHIDNILKLHDNLHDAHTETLQMNRQQLEKVYKNRGLRAYKQFFERIMLETHTIVFWPDHESLMHTRRRNVIVKIVGEKDHVLDAKKRIQKYFQPRGRRVSLEMDVPHKFHSYIIGRGGENLKRIVEATTVCIQFSRSSFNNDLKLNQVVLNGPVDQVERARSLLRSNSPLMYIFEFPHPIETFKTHPYVQLLEVLYHVRIVFSNTSLVQKSQLSVQGSELLSAQVGSATQLLMNFIWGTDAREKMVRLEMDITTGFHEFVKGFNNINLINIMHSTQTCIIFPNLMNMHSLKSNIVIYGCIENVNRARQQLLGNLPVTLKFDYLANPREEPMDDDQLELRLQQLSLKYGLEIRQFHLAEKHIIKIKTAEKFIDNIYGAHCEIMGFRKPIMRASIPYYYYQSNDIYLANLMKNYPIIDGGFRFQNTPVVQSFLVDKGQQSAEGNNPPYNYLWQDMNPDRRNGQDCPLLLSPISFSQ